MTFYFPKKSLQIAFKANSHSTSFSKRHLKVIHYQAQIKSTWTENVVFMQNKEKKEDMFLLSIYRITCYLKDDHSKQYFRTLC